MKYAAVFKAPDQNFEIRRFPVAKPSSGNAGLTLVASGICGTDVHIHGGFLPMPSFPLIIGHEFIGKIDALADADAADAFGNPLKKGDTAIACVAIPCGKCFNCRRGETASCLAFGVTYARNVEEAPHFFGGFAEYLYSPLNNLVKLTDDIDPFAAAAFPCGGPTVIRACEYGGGLEPGEIVVIQGNGSLGLFALAWAKAHGCRTIVIGSAANPGRTASTNELAPELFFDYRKDSAAEISAKIKEYAATLDRGDGADVVIETSGSQNAFPVGLALLRTRGRYFVPGQYSNRGLVSIEPQQITFRALRVIGSSQYTMNDIKTYLDFLKTHPDLQAVFARMVAKYPLKSVNTAMADAKAGKAVKCVFVSEE